MASYPLGPYVTSTTEQKYQSHIVLVDCVGGVSDLMSRRGETPTRIERDTKRLDD